MKGCAYRAGTRVATQVGHLLHALHHVYGSFVVFESRAVEHLKRIGQVSHGCRKLFDVCVVRVFYVKVYVQLYIHTHSALRYHTDTVGAYRTRRMGHSERYSAV